MPVLSERLGRVLLARLDRDAKLNAMDHAMTLGLDAAIPAGFLALLWPRLVDRSAWALALAAGGFALLLAPYLRPGMPVLAGAGIAVVGAMWLAARAERRGPA